MLSQHLFAIGLVGISLGLADTTAAPSATYLTTSLFLLSAPSPVPTVFGQIISAGSGTTLFNIRCEPPATLSSGQADPCSLIGGVASVLPSSVVLTLAAVSTSAPGGLPVASATTTRSVTCQLNANTASCSGAMTINATSHGTTSKTASTISQVVTDVSHNLIPVTLTSGTSPLITATSTSTGGVPKMTHHAALVGVAAVLGGVAML